MVGIIYKAVLIGVNKYSNPCIQSLNNVVNDIMEMGKILGNSAVDYGQSNLMGIHANKENINKYLEDLFSNCNKDDILFLYWAGHGSSDGDGCFLTYDTDIGNIVDTSIQMNYVRNLIENANAKAIVVMFDCCYSGNAARGTLELKETMERGLKISGKGKVIIAACDYFEVAYEHDKEAHGRFTYNVLKGIEGEAADEAGNVDIFSLYRYISAQMSKCKPAQTPVLHCTVTSPIILNIIEQRKQNIIYNKNTENTNCENIISQSGKWCLLNLEPIKYNGIIENGDSIEVKIVNPSSKQITILRDIKKKDYWNNNIIQFTFREFSKNVNVETVNIEYNLDTIYILKLAKTKEDSGNITEVSVGLGGFRQAVSPKEIAEYRARRILLGEDRSPGFSHSEWGMLNMFIGQNGASNFRVDRPIIKDFINEAIKKSGEDWELVRLYMVYYLMKSCTVEYVEKLNLFIDNDSIAKVEFIGIRQKIYSNVEPERIILNDKTLF